MSTPKGTVHARTVRDDAAEYALIDRWGGMSPAQRAAHLHVLTKHEIKVLVDAYGSKDARGE